MRDGQVEFKGNNNGARRVLGMEQNSWSDKALRGGEREIPV